MLKKLALFIALVGSVLILANASEAAVTGYVSNPTTNSTDWRTNILGMGGSVNSNVNFDNHPTGALQSGFYSISDGVTLTPNGDVSTVQYGAGPAQGNTTSTPASSGEDLHPASNYLYDGPSVSDLTISFNSPVLGAGLFVIDHFNPNSGDILRISAFDGADGTGNLLGSFDSVQYNFQNNYMYFMGVTSSDNNIRSLRFYDLYINTGDTTGIDDIVFGTTGGGGPTQAIPEPATMSLLGLGLLGLAGLKKGNRA